MKMYLKSLENRDTKVSLQNKDVTVFTQAELIFLILRNLQGWTCCVEGRRSRLHTPPPFLRVWRAKFPSGGGHVSLRVTRVAGSCVLHRYMGHLSPDPRDHSLLLPSVCSMTDCITPLQTWLPATANTTPTHLHSTLDAYQTLVDTYAPIHTRDSSDNLRLIQLLCCFMHGWLE